MSDTTPAVELSLELVSELSAELESSFGPYLATVAARIRPSWLTELLSLCGLAGIVISSLVLNSSTAYPGSAVALPVASRS